MKLNLTIGWLYPQLMNIYGDRGNVLVLQKRCEWRNIDTKVHFLDLGFDYKQLQSCDLILMGGAQDRQQKAISEDLFKARKIVKNLIEKGVPGLYVCGAYQFLGNYYMEANGNKIEGLGIFDLYTKSPGDRKKRLIGNAAFKSTDLDYTLIGFENHGGRTFLSKNIKPFGKVLKGFGNNGEDGFEGANYKNSFGTYLHGPLLPKNPVFADFLIQKALEVKYKTNIQLPQLDDTLEYQAHNAMLQKLNINNK